MKRLKIGLIFSLSLCVTLIACNKKTEDPFPADMRQTVSTDAELESVTNEIDDIALSALITADVPVGRYAMTADDRITCANLFFDSTANRVTGSVVIDFGTGCTDGRGNTRAGKILIAWISGRWFKVGSHTTIGFQSYSINGVKFADSDIRTLHNVSSVSSPFTWTLEASHSLTWPDLTGGNRIVHLTRQWVVASNHSDDRFVMAQSRGTAAAATGINRYGKTYSVIITTPIEYLRSCISANKVLRPVKGVRTVTYDANKTVTMDFGNGTCDGSFTASTTATTRTITFKNDGADVD